MVIIRLWRRRGKRKILIPTIKYFDMATRLSLEALVTLDAIERKGSFAAAADELHRVPSALSYTMQKLEADLDVRLFDRSRRKAVLTPAGRELLDEGRQLLALADSLECRVRQVAKGWEVELRIALDNLVPAEALLELVPEFDRLASGTRLRIFYEVLGGTWDALVSGRADLTIGASGEPPSLSGFTVREMNRVRFLFCVAPGHPLARESEPLRPSQILAHRAIAVGDSSRITPPRSAGLLAGQELLVVPDFAAKVAAQRLGLGVGYLPESVARAEEKAGSLLVKKVSEPKRETAQYAAWRTDAKGKALAWWLARLDPKSCARAVARQRIARFAS
jgi:DNA-binding transcriptional LysR family regulator